VPVIEQIAKCLSPRGNHVRQVAYGGGWDLLELVAVYVAEELRSLRVGNAPLLLVNGGIDVAVATKIASNPSLSKKGRGTSKTPSLRSHNGDVRFRIMQRSTGENIGKLLRLSQKAVIEKCSITRSLRLELRPVLTCMTSGTQGNQVQVVIRALLATQLLVVHLQVLFAITELAPPAIAPQYLFS
jgi:hypothetical protein